MSRSPGRERDLRDEARLRTETRLTKKARALELLGEGMGPLLVSRRIGVAVRTVHRWRQESGHWRVATPEEGRR
jgi:transposase-like protein